MMIATDPQGNVVMAGSSLPTEWNGMTLTVHELGEEQQAAYDALPSDRGGAMFDGSAFVALPADKTRPAPSAEQIFKAAVKAKLNITDADLAQASASLSVTDK